MWRLGGVILLSQLGLYSYERLRWEAGGRERRARSSFLSHFQARARSLVPMVAASVRQQIHQVTRYFNREGRLLWRSLLEVLELSVLFLVEATGSLRHILLMMFCVKFCLGV